ITASIFPKNIDYLALGHLHVPQKISGSENMRYSGSPIPIGFGEINHKKSVCMVEFTKNIPSVTLLDIPLFQHLETITGDWEHIQSRILELKVLDNSIWLEINYEGNDIITDLRERLENAVNDTKIKILRIKNKQVYDKVLGQIDDESLDELSVNDVFERCLEINNIPRENRQELLDTYRETLNTIYEEDKQAQ
ncbi:MAG: exonuclease SbcCD subunit D C-terminal domain-containing protein, partial [Fibrobacter sp.]|nr:exonuclease SbcCD subunit D C-terminal domain-containing protein [Fibrobacter sp.]